MTRFLVCYFLKALGILALVLTLLAAIVSRANAADLPPLPAGITDACFKSEIDYPSSLTPDPKHADYCKRETPKFRVAILAAGLPCYEIKAWYAKADGHDYITCRLYGDDTQSAVYIADEQ